MFGAEKGLRAMRSSFFKIAASHLFESESANPSVLVAPTPLRDMPSHSCEAKKLSGSCPVVKSTGKRKDTQ
jgi:hypothetical protein